MVVYFIASVAYMIWSIKTHRFAKDGCITVSNVSNKTDMRIYIDLRALFGKVRFETEAAKDNLKK